MIASTLCVSWPNALSLVWARSMFNARSNPPLAGQGGEPAADRADRGQSDLADRCERGRRSC